MTLDLFATELRISHVYAFRNGAVVTFDQHNRIIPEFTGEWDVLEAQIRAAAGTDTQYHHAGYDIERGH